MRITDGIDDAAVRLAVGSDVSDSARLGRRESAALIDSHFQIPTLGGGGAFGAPPGPGTDGACLMAAICAKTSAGCND